MKPRHAQLPIWRDANRLLIEIEQAVRKFPRYHKYALGSDLRRQVGAGLPALEQTGKFALEPGSGQRLSQNQGSAGKPAPTQAGKVWQAPGYGGAGYVGAVVGAGLPALVT